MLRHRPGLLLPADLKEQMRELSVGNLISENHEVDSTTTTKGCVYVRVRVCLCVEHLKLNRTVTL